MKNPKPVMYVKFKMDSSGKFPVSFIMSETREHIDAWDGTRKASRENRKKEEQPEKNSQFRTISREFERDMEIFQTAVPYVMSVIPFAANFELDINVRQYIAKHGTKLKGGEFEIYEFPYECFKVVNDQLDRLNAIMAGSNNLPNMFLMGLVSSYDAFLAKLIRAIFIARPEILSSSERNLSFKDLVEIGSIDAARERIIEKEIETIMRSSHGEQISWLEGKLKIGGF